MTTNRLILIAIVSALAWIGAVLLVATQASTEPVGTAYDLANRLLTGALVLLVVATVAFHRSDAGRDLPGMLLVAGLAVMLAGNVVEFWGALVAGQQPSATAQRLATPEFWGSTPGFLLFLVGQLPVVIGLIAIAIRDRRHGRAGMGEALLIGASGIAFVASTALWAMSPAAAAIPAVIFGFGWLALARVRAHDAGSSR